MSILKGKKMKVFIVAIFSSILLSCGQSTAQNSLHATKGPGVPAVAEIVIPQAIAEALVINYELGRQNWDSYGVSQVRHFSVKTVSMNTTEIVAEMIRRSPMEREGSLADFCGYNLLEDMDDRSLEECAAYVVQPGSNNRVQGFLTNISNRESQFDEHIRFNTAIRTINAFVSSVMGNDYLEYSASMNISGVDVVTSILVDHDQKNILVITWDYGA